MLPRLRVLATGGTIAGKAERAAQASRYTAASLPVAEVLAGIDGLASMADVQASQICAIDSKDADPDFWRLLAAHVQDALNDPDIDAVMVLHGTDTMEETAWFLQMALRPVKPVVLTGAMRPANALSADGPMNVLQAATVACDPDAVNRGVLVVLNGEAHAARYVRKAHTSQVQAFSSGEHGVVASVGDAVHWREPAGAAPMLAAPPILPVALPRVDLLVAYPGAPTDAIEHAVSAGARGIVYAGTGHGTLSQPVLSALALASQAHVAVVRATRIEAGRVCTDIGCRDRHLGFISSGSLSAGKARIALMLLLAQDGAGRPWPMCLDDWSRTQA